jgi:hypothetical protein
VVVVENNCTDHTAEIVRGFMTDSRIPRLRYLHETRQGVAFARRRAVLESQAWLVAFIDDDCLLAEDWIEQALDFACAHRRAGAFGGKNMLVWEAPPSPLAELYGESLARQDRGELPHRLPAAGREYPVGSGLVLRREAVLASRWVEFGVLTGRRGDQLTAGEDSELLLRVRHQAPHRELGAGGAPAPCAYIVNVPLARCGPENGSIEVWPGGTHLWRPELLQRYGISDDVQDGPNAEMEALASLLPSHRLSLEVGSVLIRDPGMLHRGTPNATDAPRTMLTLSYLRRGHHHDYGDARFNLDGELDAKLAPAVRCLFPEVLRGPAPPPAPTASVSSRRRRAWRWSGRGR